MKRHIAERIRNRLDPTAVATPVGNKHVPVTSDEHVPMTSALDKFNVDELRHQLTGSLHEDEIKECIEDIRQGKVYTLESISRMLRCSYEAVRLIFMKEPGVVKVRQTYRVPETVLR